MEIIFVSDGNEKAYSKYIPGLQKRIFFRNSGEKQEISDDIAEQLLKDFPRMFGRSLEEVKKARGIKAEILIKEEVDKVIPPVEEKPKEHPMVKAFKKVEKAVETTEGYFEKVDRKPVKKLEKKGK